MRWKQMVAGALAAAMLLAPGWADENTDWDHSKSAVDAETGDANVAAWVIDNEVAAAAALTLEAGLPVRSAVLMEQSTGRMLYAMNEDAALPPASVTKIMSLLLFMEAIDAGTLKLDDRVTCSANAAGFGGSQIWLKEGEQMSVNDLLKAVAIGSANDATVCLAEHLAGSETAFVALMNQRAAELGMENTIFKCCAGLDTPGHVTTARDIALMSRELLRHPRILDYSTVWMDSLRDGATQLVNTNRLVRFYPGATGLKTGTTSGAGSCLSATATRDGLGLIAVVMGASTSDERFAAARALLDWGFATYLLLPLEAPELAAMPVSGGVEKQVELACTPPEGVVVEKRRKDDVTQELILPESLPAPVRRGDTVGSVAVMLDGERIAEYPVTACADVDEMTFGRALGILWRRLLALK